MRVFVVISSGNPFWPKENSIIAVFSAEKDANDFCSEVSERIRRSTCVNTLDQKMFRVEEHQVDRMLGLDYQDDDEEAKAE